MKPIRQLIAAVLCVVAPAIAIAAGTFTITSLNTLHLGWGNKKIYGNLKSVLNDSAKAVNLSTAPNALPDVILLQEVMPKYVNNHNPPGGDISPASNNYYIWERSQKAEGRGSYLEYYGFLIKQKPPGSLEFVKGQLYDNGGAAAKKFIRPPYGVLLRAGQEYIWVVNYHALFGKSLSQRLNEISDMGNVYGWFSDKSKTGIVDAKVIICGDWNVNEAVLKGHMLAPKNMEILPNGLTSLNRDGVTSSSYDHCVWDKQQFPTATAKVSSLPTNNMRDYRNTVSDHLPITMIVPYK